MILCDTNILIEFYKNNFQIISELRFVGLNQLAISTITQAELYYGAINNVELKKIKKHLQLIHIFPVDITVSDQFIELMETYSFSHKLSIPDAFIASTALVHKIDLYTLNVKDFRFIVGLNLHQSSSNYSS
ncbi:MAG: type II toxin-antitoxin system VapC family toxin [Dolichospermum sp. DET50]|nr:type II toxin-antitoxin system VapC family toxin [Dolichospermum sp. DET66]MBS3031279.1 type II toxin-antitoxin system VapC family toxin [Dolichospermum sp. DET67]MBS3036489.1 type II toxin-antitoxin system VapC family toxin [Dolichospermum sp. DET50]QSX68538.1 MAG: type II toxin-antitoxin system VapC family toxin [Dolichospermum sp. DET69]